MVMRGRHLEELKGTLFCQLPFALAERKDPSDKLQFLNNSGKLYASSNLFAL